MIKFETDAFIAGLREWQKANQLSNDEVIVAMALNLAENIIRATPVDTGWARANWYPTINQKPDPPNTGKSNPNHDTQTTVGLHGKTKRVALDKNSAAGAQKSLDRTGQVFAGGKSGDVFTLANGVPYIAMLENGYSKQAPLGMVANSVAKIRNFISTFQAPSQ
jgi:hypothetical protein